MKTSFLYKVSVLCLILCLAVNVAGTGVIFYSILGQNWMPPDHLFSASGNEVMSYFLHMNDESRNAIYLALFANTVALLIAFGLIVVYMVAGIARSSEKRRIRREMEAEKKAQAKKEKEEKLEKEKTEKEKSKVAEPPAALPAPEDKPEEEAPVTLGGMVLECADDDEPVTPEEEKPADKS